MRAVNRPRESSTPLLLSEESDAHHQRATQRGKADEISAAMLAQLCEIEGYATISFSVVQSPLELLEKLSPQAGDVVCISALPPFALMNARTLSKNLRVTYPNLP